MRLGRILAGVVVAGGVVFGLMGGEYSTMDWLQLRRQVGEEQRSIKRLQFEIDSLRVYAESLETDSIMQERVAREQFGMLRDGEILYRVEPVPW